MATTCVAQVMIRLREEAAKMPHANWIIEYTGRDKEFDPAFIKINVAPDTHSFLLVQEYWHIEKEAFVRILIFYGKHNYLMFRSLLKNKRKRRTKT